MSWTALYPGVEEDGLLSSEDEACMYVVVEHDACGWTKVLGIWPAYSKAWNRIEVLRLEQELEIARRRECDEDFDSLIEEETKLRWTIENAKLIR